MTRPELVVVILAGGEGTRIGGGKPLRRIGQETLVARAVRMARRWSPAVAIAVRSDTQVGGVDAERIHDEPSIEGPLGGLAAALAYAGGRSGSALLTIPCDAPFLPDDLPDRLSNGIGGGIAALAASAGRLHPTCALWRPQARDALPAYLATGRRSLLAFAECVGFVAVEWAVEPVDPFFNINSEADRLAAEALLGRDPGAAV